MVFCNKQSKFSKGDEAFVLNPQGEYISVKIKDIGIIGGKLSRWVFFYDYKASDGTIGQVAEEFLYNKEEIKN